MVAINGREVISRAVGILNAPYRCLGEFLFGRPTTLNRSRSFVSANLKQPIPKVTAPPLSKTRSQVTQSGQASKRRKHGRVEPKGYNDLARDNSTVFLPGGFRKETKKKKPPPRKTCDVEREEDDYDDGEPIDCDPESSDEDMAELSAQGRWLNPKMTIEEQELVMRELRSLEFQKSILENQFKVKATPGRVKAQTAEKKAGSRKEKKEANKLGKQEQRSPNVARTCSWKDRRLAQLEKEKDDVQSRLARERIERQRSRYQRKVEEQQRRRESDGHWKRLREDDAKVAAQREDNLLRENAMLQGNLQFKHNVYLMACDERERMKQEREEEKSRRLRAEGSLHRWKELMEEYFPGGQVPQQRPHPQQPRSHSHSRSQPEPEPQPQPQPQPKQPPSHQAQFELYEKKWEVLRSGVDIDGTKVHLIYFSQIPWPLIDMDLGILSPNQILPEHVVKFFLHPLRIRPDPLGEGKSKKSIAKDELRRWHSDKFDSIVLSKVREEDKAAAAKVAGMITRVLTDMKDSN